MIFDLMLNFNVYLQHNSASGTWNKETKQHALTQKQLCKPQENRMDLEKNTNISKSSWFLFQAEQLILIHR